MKANSGMNLAAYIEEAIFALETIAAGSQSSVLGNFMKAAKGETFVLKILLNSESPVSPTQLSEALHSSKSRISAILRSLEKKGDIRREIDKKNRRNILVSITESGKKHIIQDMKYLHDIMAALLLEMGENDTREFVRLAKKMTDTMQHLKGF